MFEGELNIFAGFPKSGLHAGGLRYGFCDCEECYEDRGGPPPEPPLLLEHDPAIQYRKEGVFAFTAQGETEEMLYPIKYHMSDRCIEEGITWDWIPERKAFGNGIVVRRTSASPTYKLVIQGTELSEEEYVELHGPTPASSLVKEYKHIRHSSWMQYESRWALDGNGNTTCPQEPHLVYLTYIITTHHLPDFVYNRLRDIIERGAEPKDKDLYPAKHFSAIRKYNGKPAFTVMVGR